MPSFVLIALAVSAAANLAGIAWLQIARPRQPGGAWRTSAGWLIGVPLGIYLGCAILGEWPHWPPTNDRHRVLVQLLPMVVVIETIVVLAAKPWVTMLLRGAAAALIAPLLLSKTIYLADLAGPGSAKWTGSQAAIILGGIAAMIAVDWLALSKLQQRASDRSVGGMLALVNACAGMTVVMSGYLRGGLMGLPWAGAMLGAAVATLWGPAEQRRGSLVGVGLLGMAYVLLVGHFFGALDVTFALVIAVSPLLAWIPEAPAMKSWPQGRRELLRWGLVALPLVVVVTLAAMKFWQALADDPML